MTKLSLLVLIFSLAAGCSSSRPGTLRLEGELTTAHIDQVGRYLAGQLLNHITAAKIEQPVYIEMRKLHNRSSEHIDTLQIWNSLSAALPRRQARIIDRENRLAALEQIRDNMSGAADGTASADQLKAARFFLSGSITEQVVSEGTDRVQVLRITLLLSSVETGTVSWQKNFDIQQSGATGSWRW